MARRRAAWHGDEALRAGWKVPDRETVSDWAGKNRVLSDRDSAEPGPYSNARTPYLVEIMDSLGDPECVEILVMKAAQVGMTEVSRNAMGFWIDQDPGPALLVMPTEADAKEVLDERVQPMIRETKCLSLHALNAARPFSRRRIMLDNMDIHVAWAGSPGSLARRPVRYLVLDEIDKYPLFSGKEADPISLGKKRLTTFGHRAKCAAFSTPTTRNGPTWKMWEATPTKKHYHMPCPHCGVFSPPSFQQVKWPKDLEGDKHAQAEAIERDNLAWYECVSCGKKMLEKHKASMLAGGKWVAENQSIDKKGKITGPPTDARRRAYHIPGLLSPWISFSQLASEWLNAIGDDALMMDFRNSRLGETYEVQAVSMRTSEFADKIKCGYTRGIVPLWAGMVLATADTQKDHFVYAIRAHGYGWKSRLIDHGKCFTFEELRTKCLDTPFPMEDPGMAHAFPFRLMIDSGGGIVEGEDHSRTNEVYQFAMSDPGRIIASKGIGGRAAERGGMPVRMSSTKFSLPGESAESELALAIINVGYFKDILAKRIKQLPEAADAWEMHEDVDADYCRQLTSERKILIREGRLSSMRWVKVTAHARNEAWDIETMQIALAQLAHVEQLDPPEAMAFARSAEKVRRENPLPPAQGMLDHWGRPFDVRKR